MRALLSQENERLKSENQLRKLPESKPGMAILEFSIASAYIVDSFR